MSSFKTEEAIPPKIPTAAAAKIKKLALEILFLRQLLMVPTYFIVWSYILAEEIIAYFFKIPAKLIIKQRNDN